MQDKKNILGNAPTQTGLALIYESMSDGVVGFDADGRIVFANPGMGLIVGCPIGELIGKTAEEAWGEVASASLGARSGTVMEQEILRPDGAMRTVTAKTFTLFDDSPIHVVIYRDVTRLRRRERLLHAIFESNVTTGGDEFLGILMRELAVALRVQYALVAETNGSGTAQVLAFWCRGDFGPTYEYELANSPFADPQTAVAIGRGAAREFHKDEFLATHKVEFLVTCPLMGSDGHPMGFMAVMHDKPRADSPDIQPLMRLFAARAGSELERKHSEQALRDSEARLSSIVQSAADAIISISEEGVVESVNSTVERMFGYRESEIVGKSINLLIPKCFDMGKSALGGLLETAKGETPTPRSYNCRRRDGTSFPGEFAISQVSVEGRTLFVGLLRDITDRKKQEEALFESEKRFRTLIENIPTIAVQGYDRAGRIFFWNEASERIYGYSKEYAIGKSVGEVIVSIGNPSNVERNLREGGKTGKKMPPEETEVLRKDGSSVCLYTNYEQLRNARGEIEFYRIDLDITDLRRTEKAFIESEIRYRQLVELSPQAMAVLQNGKFVFVNKAATVLFGATTENALHGRDLLEFVHPADREKVVEAMYFVEAARHSQLVRNVNRYLEERLISLDGKVIEVEAASIPITYEGKPSVQYIARNITEKKMAERALRDSEERYALAAKGANDGLWDWNMTSDTVYYSVRWLEMLGLEPDDMGSSPQDWFSLIHEEDLKEFHSKLDDHLNRITPHFEVEIRLKHRDDGWRWMLCRGLAIFEKDGTPSRMAGSVRDITSRKETENQLMHDALHDSLTGLANRGLFTEHLQRALARSKRGESLFAVLFLDFDRFKVVNDSLGHAVGDKLLIAISRRLERLLRPGDLFSRLGGDEFGLLLEDLDTGAEAKRVSERIQESFTRPFEIEGHEIFTSASIGIAFNSDVYHKAGDILRDADTAMYRAKTLGKARHVVFDQRMRHKVQSQLEMETDLRRAVERKELEIEYQPIISIETERLHGFEALVRWNHPRHGRISPADFIPLAEETGVIVPLGLQVLKEACVRVRDWQEDYKLTPPIFVSVNISARQLVHPDLIECISKILEQTRVNPACLKLELTESMLLEHADFSIQVLQQLRELGIKICIDDFGTGYSSLSYLHRLPANTLKVDRSFVSGLNQPKQHAQLVPTIINLAQILGMDVIAEGIETQQQFQVLKGLGCDYAQGYLFSKPLPVDKASDLIKRNLSMFSSSTHKRL